MKYLHLIWAALFRRKTRTILTLVSIIAAFLLFGLLDTVRVAFNPGDSVVGAGRLNVTSKVSMMDPLPKNLGSELQRVEGVSRVAYANWFGGFYKEARNQIPSFAISPNYLDLYPEAVVPQEQRESWEKNQVGLIVGQKIAQKFGWELGDQVPLQSSIWPSKSSGSNTWIFEIEGIMHGVGENGAGWDQMALMHWKYFNENNQYRSDEVHWYVVQVADPMHADAVAKRIDALSANSDHETRTQTEQAFMASFMKQLVDIALIVMSIMGAVFFTLLLLTGNTMMQAVRERTKELAILRTIGFSSFSVLAMVLAESVLLLLMGGVIGMGLVSILVPGIAVATGGMIPVTGVSAGTWLTGLGLMILIGIIVGLLPALRAMHLNMVDALRSS